MPAPVELALPSNVRSVASPVPGARLYVPNDREGHPGVLFLHGSEGGAARFIDRAALSLCEAGFAVLVFPYFGVPGAPPKLHRVELSRTMDALAGLRESSAVKGHPVGLFGSSRGAEHALLIAGLLGARRFLGAVAAHAAPATTWGAFDPTTRGAIRDRMGQKEPAWTVEGRPIPAGTPLELERYEGPVFLSHGTEDRVWPAELTRLLEQRLRGAGRDVEVAYLDGEGHVPSPPARAALAQRRAAFFRRHLTGRQQTASNSFLLQGERG